MSLHLIAADYINDLVHPFTTSERPDHWPVSQARYVRRHPALLDQLENTATSSTTGGEAVRTAPGGRPAGRIDVLAFLGRLEGQSRAMALDHEIDLLPLRPRLTKLGGAISVADGRALAAVRSWWVTARVLTSFDVPAFAPNVPCPNELCERRGSLRVRVAEPADQSVAVCVECHTTWSSVDFGVFAMWVSWAFDHLNAGHRCDECIGVHEKMAERAEQRKRANGSDLQKSRYASSRR